MQFRVLDDILVTQRLLSLDIKFFRHAHASLHMQASIHSRARPDKCIYYVVVYYNQIVVLHTVGIEVPVHYALRQHECTNTCKADMRTTLCLRCLEGSLLCTVTVQSSTLLQRTTFVMEHLMSRAVSN